MSKTYLFFAFFVFVACKTSSNHSSTLQTDESGWKASQFLSNFKNDNQAHARIEFASELASGQIALIQTLGGIRELGVFDPATGKTKIILNTQKTATGRIEPQYVRGMPDGKLGYITQESARETRGSKYTYGIVLLDLSTGKNEIVYSWTSRSSEAIATLSPMADEKILYTAYEGTKFSELWIIDLKTKTRQPLHKLAPEAHNWDAGPGVEAADGRIIYLTNRARYPTRQLWILDPKTGSDKPLVVQDDAAFPMAVEQDFATQKDIKRAQIGAPSVLTDKRLAFTACYIPEDVPPQAMDHYCELWAMDLSSGQKERLTRYDQFKNEGKFVNSSRPVPLKKGSILYVSDNGMPLWQELWILNANRN